MLLNVLGVPVVKSQVQQGPAQASTFRTTSRLVFLDVTVLDNKDRPVVKGLTKSDFVITENKKPQPIFSFDPPESHVADVNMAADNPTGKVPVTIFVLDR